MNSLIDIFDGMMPLNPFTTGLIGFITGWALLFWRSRGHHPDLCKNTLLSIQEKLSATELQVSELRKTNHQIQTQLAVSESQRDQSQKLATDLSSDVETHQQMVAQIKLTHTELSTRMEHERKTSDEKIRLLQNAELQFTHHFESLANKILEENSKKFSEQNNSNSKFRKILGRRCEIHLMYSELKSMGNGPMAKNHPLDLMMR